MSKFSSAGPCHKIRNPNKKPFLRLVNYVCLTSVKYFFKSKTFFSYGLLAPCLAVQYFLKFGCEIGWVIVWTESSLDGTQSYLALRLQREAAGLVVTTACVVP